MNILFSLYHFGWSLLGPFLYWFPSRRMRVIGVTGTKGKSTTLSLLSHILSYAGKKTALISSVHVQIGSSIQKNPTGNSMPGRMFLQRFLRRAVRAGCSYALIEVTSQGIVQHRHRFISWNSAVFLDIHPEHIESHGSFEKYLAAKVSFFSYVSRKCRARKPMFFCNADDPQTDRFKEAARPYPVELFSSADVSDFLSSIPQTLPGDFNKINIAAAIAIARSEGVSDDVIRNAISSFPGLLGRMTIVSRKPLLSVVDYAHTPESLEAVYSFLKQQKTSDARMICVLGACGGGRDKWKRPVMGSIAGRYCSTLILTNEDPYDEDPQSIIRDIREGVEKSGSYEGEIFEIEDRESAIQKAVSIAQEGDVLVCTGKGSEPFMHMEKGKKIPWTESEFVYTELHRQGKYQRI